MREFVETFPRDLTPLEQDLLTWLLPEDRPGYRDLRDLIRRWKVTARGRRGPGNYVLSPPDERVDLESPLPQVLAFGVVETDRGEISACVREPMGRQVEYEISKLGAGELDAGFHEHRRWTFSAWRPGSPCPKCGKPVREVGMRTKSGRALALAVCPRDERVWVHDGVSGMCLPVPVTNFYNELMLLQRVRDPEIALDPRRLFPTLDTFTDRDLTAAFRTYNMIRTKVAIEDDIVVPEPVRPSLLSRLAAFFQR